jgi:nucleoside-diphosphate-sugar epimerase
VARGEDIPPGDSFQPAIVVHSAWPGADPSSWDPFRDWSLRLRSDAADRGAWFVGIGSGLEAHAGHAELKEPYKTYALQKVELREALAALTAQEFAWIRLHFMFGPGERPTRVVPAAIRAALTGEEFVCGSLERRRRWLHVDDQADYLARFLEAPQAGNFDISGRNDVSFRDLLTLIEHAVGHSLRLRESDAPAPDSSLKTIVAEKILPAVPADAGSQNQLSERLSEYAKTQQP